MIAYYVESSLFQSDETSMIVIKRLFTGILCDQIHYLIVSGFDYDREVLENIRKRLKEYHVEIITTQEELQRIDEYAELDDLSLRMSNLPEMFAFDGSYVKFDTTNNTVERYYYNLCLSTELSELKMFEKELENLIKNKLQGKKLLLKN